MSDLESMLAQAVAKALYQKSDEKRAKAKYIKFRVEALRRDLRDEINQR